MENLEKLISKCVLKQIPFSGLAGGVYTVQDLVHSTSKQTLNKLYKRYKKELESLDDDSLFENSNTAKKSLLSIQVDTIKEVFSYKKSLEDKEKSLAEKRERKESLRDLLAQKKVEEFKNKSLEEIEKELQELESTN